MRQPPQPNRAHLAKLTLAAYPRDAKQSATSAKHKQNREDSIQAHPNHSARANDEMLQQRQHGGWDDHRKLLTPATPRQASNSDAHPIWIRMICKNNMSKPKK
jgi:hypothetical protein